MSALITRRAFLRSVVAAAVAGHPVLAADRHPRRLNFVLINCDDLGYGDLSCYGSPTIHTPNVDSLAAKGVRFTDFDTCAPVCTPSRAGLLTGRYAIRSGLTRILGPVNTTGIPESEQTIGEALKSLGYATALIGKWHLGHLPQFLPTRHGFDYYYGIPYSNNMGDRVDGRPNCPLMRGEQIIEQPAIQETLTERYTAETIGFIKQNKDKPFFVYLAHNMPHNPVSASERFRGRSKGGLYGDAVECIDWGVGQIVNTLRELGLERNTLIMFTSDNGPNLGSAGILRGKKGQVFEGGVRVPFVAYCPGLIPAGIVCHQPATNLDIFPTLIRLAGGKLPSDRPIDGRDITKLLTVPGASLPSKPFFYFVTNALQAVRVGKWKLHLGREDRLLPKPELYNLQLDIRESVDRSDEYPHIVTELKQIAQRFVSDLPGGAHIGGSDAPF
ncbi:MAG: sulfatase [Armatimonadota bacterium]|nr:sulfatase [Armatimonadota bacterium]